MVIERFLSGAEPVYARATLSGRMLPDALNTSTAGSRMRLSAAAFS